MELKILKKYYIDDIPNTPKIYQGIFILFFRSKYFQFKLFTDCGEWFLYIHIGKRWWRFGSAGYLKGFDTKNTSI